jgi:hypothetical protein
MSVAPALMTKRNRTASMPELVGILVICDWGSQVASSQHDGLLIGRRLKGDNSSIFGLK